MTTPFPHPKRYPVARQITGLWLATLNLAAGTGPGLTGDPAQWPHGKFVTASGPVGGSPGKHVAARNPVMQIDCWAFRPRCGGSIENPADELAEQVLDACYRPIPLHQIQVPDEFRTARVMSVYPLSEPRRFGNESMGLVRCNFDLQVHWAWSE